MIEFLALRIENFLSVKEASLPLDKQGLVLIEGINEDDPSAKSNGAGKSSIVDAISWSLYGETARGVTGDAVINVKAGKGTYVGLTFTVDGVQYKIDRGRKHKDLKNRVQLFMWDSGWVDQTLGTDKLTQEKINHLLGCTPDIFNTSIYMGQEAMPDLPNMTDKALKAILEQAMSLDRLDEALEVCKERYATLFHVATTATNNIKSLSHERDLQRDEVDKYTDFLKAERDEYEKLKREAESEFMAYAEAKGEMSLRQTKLENHYNALPNIDVEAIMAALEIEKAIKMEAVKETESKLERVQEITSTRRARVYDIKKRLRSVNDEVCPECKRPHEGAEDTTEREAALKVEMQDAVDALDRSLTAEQEFRDKIAADRSQVDGWYRTEMEKRMEVRQARIEVGKTLVACTNNIQSLTDGYTTKKSMLDRMLKSKEDMIQRHKQALDACLMRIQKVERMIEVAEVEAKEANAKLDVLEKVKHILGRKGFRGEVLDQITPYLNARTAYYLNQLTDDNITATWNTITTNSSGDYVESFHIKVEHKSGVVGFKGLSGGEKRKVRLATAMAMQDLVGTRAVKPIKLFVADEIDDAIDEAGLELLMGLLEQKAREVGTVFVISHNDIGDWVRNKVTVVKSGGQSTFKTP